MLSKLFNKCHDRRLIVISEDKTVSFHLSARTQFLSLVAVLSLVVLFGLSVLTHLFLAKLYFVGVKEKNQLYQKKSELEKQVTSLSQKLLKIEDYFEEANSNFKNKQNNTKTKNQAGDKQSMIDPLNYEQKKRNALKRVDYKVKTRILYLESIIKQVDVGFDVDYKYDQDVLTSIFSNEVSISNIVKYKQDVKHQGGPIVEQLKSTHNMFDIANKSKSQDTILHTNSAKIDNSKDIIQYLKKLESIYNSLPLLQPIKKYYVSSLYGTRTDPLKYTKSMHYGIDMVAPKNSKIYATASGVVVKSQKKTRYGNYVEVYHGNGIYTSYSHLKKRLVKKGDKVNKGDKIGIQGNTGRSTGSHLHYEVKYKNKPVDPMSFIKLAKKINFN